MNLNYIHRSLYTDEVAVIPDSYFVAIISHNNKYWNLPILKPAHEGRVRKNVFFMTFDDVTPEQVWTKRGFEHHIPLKLEDAKKLSVWVSTHLEEIDSLTFVADMHYNRSASMCLAFAEAEADRVLIKRINDSWEIFINPHILNTMREALGIGPHSPVAPRTEKIYAELFKNKISPWSITV